MWLATGESWVGSLCLISVIILCDTRLPLWCIEHVVYFGWFYFIYFFNVYLINTFWGINLPCLNIWHGVVSLRCDFLRFVNIMDEKYILYNNMQQSYKRLGACLCCKSLHSCDYVSNQLTGTFIYNIMNTIILHRQRAVLCRIRDKQVPSEEWEVLVSIHVFPHKVGREIMLRITFRWTSLNTTGPSVSHWVCVCACSCVHFVTKWTVCTPHRNSYISVQ